MSLSMHNLELQIACATSDVPDAGEFQKWLDAALIKVPLATETVIRLVDEQESAELNQRYRGKSGPTNVLSFPFDAPEGVGLDHVLGDLVVCAPVVNKEARQQRKASKDHWAHITVHGVLHLLGYDHIEDQDADEMESLEINILAALNINNPYVEEDKS